MLLRPCSRVVWNPSLLSICPRLRLPSPPMRTNHPEPSHLPCHRKQATCLRQVKRGMNWETSGPFDTRFLYSLATALSLSTTLSFLSFRRSEARDLRYTIRVPQIYRST